MVIEIELPTFPPIEFPDGYESMYPFLGTFGIDGASACIKMGVITKINSFVENTVTVEYNTEEWENIPVFVCTDIGSRSRKFADANAVEGMEQVLNPSLYFERSSQMCLVKSTAEICALNPQYGASITYVDAVENTCVLLVQTKYDRAEDEYVETVLCVLQILQNGFNSLPPVSGVGYNDIRNYSLPTFSPCIILKEKADTTYTWSLYDLRTGTFASIANNSYDDIVEVKGLSVSGWSDWLVGCIEEKPGSGVIHSACWIDVSLFGWSFSSGCFKDLSSNPMAVGYQMENSGGGACNCPPFNPDRDTSYVQYECTYHDYSTITCGVTSRTESHDFRAIGMCEFGNTPPTYQAVITHTCVGNSIRWGSEETHITDSGARLFTLAGDTSNLSGTSRISWTNRTREDHFDATCSRYMVWPPNWSDLSECTFEYDISLKANDQVVSWSTVDDQYPRAPDGLRLAWESVDTLFMSMSLVMQFVPDINGLSVGAVEHDFTPTEGVNTDGLIGCIRERWTDMTSTATDPSTCYVSLAVCFIPYDIRERIINPV